jgi:hypothetical protein
MDFNVSISTLPENFQGTPDEFVKAIAERISISTGEDLGFFTKGTTLPTTYKSPLFFLESAEGGTWYAWSVQTGSYVTHLVPRDSFRILYQSATPESGAENDYDLWVQLDGTDNLAFNNRRALGFYKFYGGVWMSVSSVGVNYGTVRPDSPNNYDIFFDVSIQTMLIYERDAWRTLAGSPGDIKFVKGTVLEDVLVQNPGWKEETSLRGHYLAGADQSITGYHAGDDMGVTTTSIVLSTGGVGGPTLNIFPTKLLFCLYKE